MAETARRSAFDIAFAIARKQGTATSKLEEIVDKAIEVAHATWASSSSGRARIRSILAAPLFVDWKIVGSLVFHERGCDAPFAIDDRRRSKPSSTQ